MFQNSDMNKAEQVFEVLKPQSNHEMNLIPYWRDDTHSLPKKALEPRDVVISTALSSRGTDIALDNAVNANGGLHVLLTYLPKDSRTERQIIGRTGRKGQPGSFKIVLDSSHLLEQLGMNCVTENEIKARRDAIEACRIDDLKSYLNVVIFQEELFSSFNLALKDFTTDPDNFS